MTFEVRKCADLDAYFITLRAVRGNREKVRILAYQGRLSSRQQHKQHEKTQAAIPELRGNPALLF
jgi:hypothetical protein